MKASLYARMQYVTAQNLPSGWPVAPALYDPKIGIQCFQDGMEKLEFADYLGFDWIGFSEHHYSYNSVAPHPAIMAAAMADRVKRARLAILAHVLPLNNPVRVAEELAMLDYLTGGRLVVGFVAVWPRALQQPLPPTHVLTRSSESAEFAASHHPGLGVSFAPEKTTAEVMSHYRTMCAEHGCEPTEDDLLFRATIMVADTDEEAQEGVQRYSSARGLANSTATAKAVSALAGRLRGSSMASIQNQNAGGTASSSAGLGVQMNLSGARTRSSVRSRSTTMRAGWALWTSSSRGRRWSTRP